jgi:hypothetical protein
MGTDQVDRVGHWSAEVGEVPLGEPIEIEIHQIGRI